MFKSYHLVKKWKTADTSFKNYIVNLQDSLLLESICSMFFVLCEVQN